MSKTPIKREWMDKQTKFELKVVAEVTVCSCLLMAAVYGYVLFIKGLVGAV